MQKMRGKFWKIVGIFQNKIPKIPEYSKKIQKNIKKIPTLISRAENAKIQKNPGINPRKIPKNI